MHSLLVLCILFLLGTFVTAKSRKGCSFECETDEVYLSVFKHNSATEFHQRSESFRIEGTFNGTRVLLAEGNPVVEFRTNKTFEYCLRKTMDLVYDLVLLDA